MQKSCSITDCQKPYFQNGFCQAHYKRWYRHGHPLAGGKTPIRSAICTVEGCGEPGKKSGMCNKHFLRVKRHGDPNFVKKVAKYATEEERKSAERAWRKREYEKHSDAYKARAEKWQRLNPERYRECLAARLADPDKQVIARRRTRRWAKDNPERKRAMDKEFYEQNKSLVRSYKAKRRAAVLRATPPWLTKEHEEQIRAVYAQAERLTQQTGTEHQVDHYVPLQGKVVSGLHVPWNLRVLTKDHNNRRPRIWAEGASDELGKDCA